LAGAAKPAKAIIALAARYSLAPEKTGLARQETAAVVFHTEKGENQNPMLKG
jgi:hypothetical protein